MRIALLTIWREKNYGAELQAYATVKLLQQMGHEVKMIDIRLSDFPRLNWKGRLAGLVSTLGPAHHKFCEFWKKNIPTTNRYRSIKAIQKNPPQADVYIVGSDQVWNPDVTLKFAELYFLNFGGDEIKRISFASSFGTEKWNFPELSNNVKKLLDKFSNLFCREDSGVRILQEEFGLEAKQVLDPTLLLENYKELIGDVCEREILTYYPLSADPELESYACLIARELGLEAVNANYCTRFLGKIEWNRPSVAEWIRSIASAKFVITRSFHGMVFSILHKRQFAVVASRNGRGTRLVSLLKQLGLEDRFYDNLDEMNEAKPWLVEIDYTSVTSRLIKIRENSIELLRCCLEDSFNQE